MNIVIILSGGTGTRMGLSIPKQYVEVNGIPVIQYCLKTLLGHKMVDMAVIAVADEWQDFVQQCVDRLSPKIPVYYSQPGDTRQGSIINALKVTKQKGAKDNDIVLIHDAARPLLSASLAADCINACKDADAVLPVIPAKDTIYLSRDGQHIDSLLERKTLWNGQAPEAFRFGSYYEANMNLTQDQIKLITGSTEVSYRAGLKCVLIPGDPANFKITTQEDLSNFQAIVNK